MASSSLDSATMSSFMMTATITTVLKEATMQTTTLQVQGMTCGHCERAVTQAVQQVDSDATVRIDRATGTVVVDSSAPREALAAAITQEGYTVAA